MTRDEFGTDLFQTVKTVGSILALQDQYAGYVNRGHHEKMKETLARRDQLRQEFAPQLDKLSDADAAEIVRRYPWVLRG